MSVIGNVKFNYKSAYFTFYITVLNKSYKPVNLKKETM